ncbi:hypothetical protein M1M25_gp007 [Tenacibaculum phage Gundel_1]|uniref:ParB/Sulfiredoxin domain-containing protein n=1 Tax=Tenacibaculum phage Gundel_1 TaxID=2745672 RepID=A0A8E4ZMW2_9CAUD|nr:hypothetical protein M1M25_gp007 [Tenacibaculum phage Gundel_1]QQV91505.1 hypothetical protein Gundel1_7 [Tenacibaculum phage Gundel_1]
MKKLNTADFLKEVNTDFNFKSFGPNDFIKKEFIKIEDLTPNQEHIELNTLTEKIKGKNLTVPHVLLYNDKKILIDGHHTVIAKLLKGQSKILCKITIR